MPIPLLLIAGAIAGTAGIGAGINGAAKMKKANDTMESAQRRHQRNNERFAEENTTTSKDMDTLGELELGILSSFGTFSDVFEQIKNRPTFENYAKNGITLPQYDGEKLKEVSVGAGVLLGGLGGAGLGAAGGFAAAGAATAAVTALGTASTGTAIATLSGVALHNAVLAALGGGALAAGGGGMALGSLVLGTATLGVGFLVGGIIFNITGSSLSDKADEAWSQMRQAEEKINTICEYLVNLRDTSNKYYGTLSTVNTIYQRYLVRLTTMVTKLGHTNWHTFTDEEKKLTENTVLLVGLLYNMCKVELVLQGKGENDMNAINTTAVEKSINNANAILMDKF